MEESILISIKKLLGITADYTNFDTDIIIHINSVLMILNQLGVGTEGFAIENDKNIWSEFTQDIDRLSAIKTYVYLKVKMLFDPPLGGAVIESTKQMINELEWRLNVHSESL